ncbi:hypothetical protein [Streptomyces sp. NRRL F-5126]|uniref:hypothetical protein n=1 Tax=Streptomyces sp. NRRL F-5126 TaxID=1463857 RepID=UPI0004C8F0AC|nr:hypothetical protein [Streptomyces sp. NRRL F-5126]
MADGRDQWLDEDTADRLLRGEPVGSRGEHAAAPAARAAAALRGLAEVTEANGGGANAQAPGEAAAVAAFRRAAHEREAGGGLATVRLAPAPRATERTRARNTPTRWYAPRGGLAAALIGCLLGSAALAVGGGVLVAPAYMGSDTPTSTPGPTAAAPGASTDATDGTASPPALAPDSSRPGGKGRALPGPDSSSALGPWESVGRGMAALGTGPGAGVPPHASHGAPSSPGAAATPSAWYTRAVGACRDLRAGTLDGARRTELLRVTRGQAGAVAFCDSLLGGSSGSGDGGSSGYLPPGGGYGPGGGSSASPSTSPEPSDTPRQPSGHQSGPPAPSSSATSSPAPTSSPSAQPVLPRELLSSDPGATDAPPSP